VNWSGPSIDCEGMQRIHTVHASSLALLALALGSFTGCDAEPTDAAPFDGPAEIAAPESVDLPILTDAEIAAVQAERRVATLTPTGSGRLELINIGDADAPEIAYVQIGSRQLGEILHQLVEEQEATPAEVFLALADAGEEVPELLVRDHEARVASQPRALDYEVPRLIETVANECLGAGGNPQSLANWVADWTDRFRFINTSVGNEFNAQNVANGGTAYHVSPDTQGRVLSACNAAQNDPQVSYWVLSNVPGVYYPYTFLWATNVDSFDAVHMYIDGGSGSLLRMIVGHSHPSPKTYVATGRCNSGC
jgi:hypothetical protein